MRRHKLSPTRILPTASNRELLPHRPPEPILLRRRLRRLPVVLDIIQRRPRIHRWAWRTKRGLRTVTSVARATRARLAACGGLADEVGGGGARGGVGGGGGGGGAGGVGGSGAERRDQHAPVREGGLAFEGGQGGAEGGGRAWSRGRLDDVDRERLAVVRLGWHWKASRKAKMRGRVSRAGLRQDDRADTRCVRTVIGRAGLCPVALSVAAVDLPSSGLVLPCRSMGGQVRTSPLRWRRQEESQIRSPKR